MFLPNKFNGGFETPAAAARGGHQCRLLWIPHKLLGVRTCVFCTAIKNNRLLAWKLWPTVHATFHDIKNISSRLEGGTCFWLLCHLHLSLEAPCLSLCVAVFLLRKFPEPGEETDSIYWHLFQVLTSRKTTLADSKLDHSARSLQSFSQHVPRPKTSFFFKDLNDPLNVSILKNLHRTSLLPSLVKVWGGIQLNCWDPSP